MHGGNDLACGFSIITGHQKFSAMLGVPKFEIGHVDVHHPVHPANTFETVVGGGVVNQGQAQTALDRDCKRFQDLRHDMLGRNEVDVVAANSLQIEHDLCKL